MANPKVTLWSKDGTRVEPTQSKSDAGWEAGEIPPAEFFNDLFYRYSDALIYLLTNGGGEWVSDTEYKAGSTVERNGKIFLSKIAQNLGNDPAIGGGNWEQLGGIGNLLSNADNERSAFAGSGGVSLDTYKTSGLNAIPSSALDLPTAGVAGMLLVSIQAGQANGSQLFVSTAGKLSVRYLVSNVWTSWATMVADTRRINGKALDNDVTLTPADVGASPSSHSHTKDTIGLVDFGGFNESSIGNIIFKTNDTAGIAPTVAQLAQGQLGINLADGILYTKNHLGVIISLGSLQPKPHTHSISDIISLQSALDAKADKLVAGVENNFMSFDASGNIRDSGKNHNTYLGKSENAVSATKLVTARNIALSGGVTGSVSFDGTANITIVVTVTNDSHTHDTRYYTKSENDNLLNAKINVSTRGVAGGVATLDGGIKIPLAQIPDGAKLETLSFATHQEMLDFDNTQNYVYMAIVNDDDGQGNPNTYIWDTQGLSWELMKSTAPVLSVNGKIGALILSTTDIAEGTNLYYTNARVLAEVRATLIKDAETNTNTLWSSSKINTQLALKEPNITKLSAFNKDFAQTEGTGSGTTVAYANHTHPTTYYTKSEMDSRYAKLAGLSTQEFSVKNAGANDKAVNLGQANALYAPISGANAGTALKWATARKLTLAGDTTGDVTFDGSANFTLTITVTNDSHTHNTQYYTKSQMDTSLDGKIPKFSTTNDYVILSSSSGNVLKGSGQTWSALKAEIAGKAQTSGTLTSGKFAQFDASGNIIASIYGSSDFEPTWTTRDLVNKAFGGTGSATSVSRSDHNHGSIYALLAGSSSVEFLVKTATNANSAINTTAGDARYLKIGANAVSATKFATARTISLGGDCSGSTSFDGTSNVTISVVVANDSHTHNTQYYTKAEIDTNIYTKAETDAIVATSVPAGTMIDFAGDTAPAGFLACNGGTVSTTTYASLYAVLGVLWANTAGASTPIAGEFRLPPQQKDGLGLYNRGVGATNGIVGTYQNDVLKSHNHSIPFGKNESYKLGSGGYNIYAKVGVSSTSGSEGDATETRPRSITVLKCIKY